MKQIVIASKEVLYKKLYFFGFLVLIPLVFSLFVIIPVKTIAGNSLEFQLSIFTQRNYVLLSILSLLTSLFLIMQIFIFKNALDSKTKLSSLGKGSVGGYAAVVASVFGTASCGACLFALFGFLGANTLFFLIEHQWYVVSGAILILLISIYFLCKKVNGVCESCRIDRRKIK